MKIFTLFNVLAFVLALAPASDLLAQHNKNFTAKNILAVEIKMNYSEQPTSIIINGQIVTGPEKLTAIKNALRDCASISWLREYYHKGEFKILFYFESNSKNKKFANFEITSNSETNLAERETLAPTKEAIILFAKEGKFPPADDTPLLDALYEAVK